MFCRPAGKFISAKYRANVLNAACAAAKLRKVRFHDLRHTFASQAIQQGVPLPVLQAWLGHSTITMTMRYAHLAPDAFQGDYGRLGPSIESDAVVLRLPRSAGERRNS